ncbi:unnamed protein product [Allacma fusca]|uniref:Uncharacterized protein n=1 Tax=Allacma fusca TaxID=39272 RepID=A0A8J2PKK6_9HEXA|nr:unnamed protein product [Allacma fusca]
MFSCSIWAEGSLKEGPHNYAEDIVKYRDLLSYKLCKASSVGISILLLILEITIGASIEYKQNETVS